MTTKLPFLLSVPHAGLAIPSRLAHKCQLTPAEVEEDGDVGAATIYSIADHAAAYVTTSVARAVLDMNRDVADRSKDGVVKTHTCWDVPIWREPLTAGEIDWLLTAHHRPYHEALSHTRAEQILCGLDLHTMAAAGPPVGPDPGAERPAVCLSNGEGTCPQSWIEELATGFRAAGAPEVRINDPFRGGYITRTHASERPWIQVELSRGPWAPLEDKRTLVLDALAAFARAIG